MSTSSIISKISVASAPLDLPLHNFSRPPDLHPIVTLQWLDFLRHWMLNDFPSAQIL